MPSQLESSIQFLNETCDAQSAYFSFTTDDSGEHGIIKANKDGLRLYAMELLKKSLEMESAPEASEVLFFDEQEWLVDDAGYNLIWGVDPTSSTRSELLATNTIPEPAVHTIKPLRAFNPASRWLPSLIILSGGLVIVTIAALKWFH